MRTNATTNEPNNNLTSLPSPQKPPTAKDLIAANVKLLVEQLEAGHSEGLTAYLTAMGRFHNLYPPLMLTVLHASERDAPKGRDRIDWKLVTDLPIQSRKEAVEKLNWYAMRWKIETFHKILKSGCKAEDVKLRTAERLVNLIAILCLLSWRIFWMTMLNRAKPEASPEMALTPTEIWRSTCWISW